MRILIAITGASGSLYAQRLLDNLDATAHDVHLILSSYAQVVIKEELPDGLRVPAGVTQHNLKSMNIPFASGSNPADVMVVIPCTMGTLGRIAHGLPALGTRRVGRQVGLCGRGQISLARAVQQCGGQ